MTEAAPRQANRSLLLVARKARGFTQEDLAEAIGVTQGVVSRWETGPQPLVGSELEEVARVLRCTPELLTRPVHPCGPIHTRKRVSAPTKPLERHLCHLTMLCVHIEPLWRSVELDAPLEMPRLSLADFRGRPDFAAEALRRSWRVPDGPIHDMVALVERAGALVFEVAFPPESKIDGLSMCPDHMPPMIFVNSAAPVDRKRWSIAHELGHVVLHHTPSGNQEKEADAFASELLMPARVAGPLLRGLTLERAIDQKWYWRTSIAALVMTAHATGGISADRKRRLFTEIGWRGWRVHEPVELTPETPRTVSKLVRHFLDTLHYSVEELAAAMGMLPEDVRETFLSASPTLRVVK